MKIIVLFAVIAAAAAVPHKALKRPNYDFVDYYDCSAKTNGSYIHPTDCTRFIICSNGAAADMACADCDTNNVAQCAGSKYLMYDAATGNCEWPADTDCVVDGPEPTEEPGSTSEPEPTTAAPPKVCNGLAAGQSCERDDCEQCGYCEDLQSFYFRCVRDFPSDPKKNVTGVISLERCDDDLWWNPAAKPDKVSLGGACDHWNNLSDAQQNAYKSDENCVKPDPLCEYGQNEADRCTGNYWFIPNPSVSTVKENLSCSTGLVWDPATETCRNRSNVAGC